MVILFYSCRTEPIRPVISPPPVKVDSETELFSQAEKMFWLKSYRGALSLYNEYLSKFPDGRSVPVALMRVGTVYTEMGKNEAARNAYRYLIDRYPGSFLVPKAKIEILATFYNEGRYEQVIRRADKVMRNVVSRDYALKLYLILGDAHAAVGSPLNAVRFYSKAHGYLRYPKKENVIARIKEAISRLSDKEILFLLERLKDPLTNGYLMYRLGSSYMNEGKSGDALRILSEFVRIFPEHEMAGKAKQLITEYDIVRPIPAPAPVPVSPHIPHTIGCLLPLTGSYKIYGNRALRGVELALSHSESGNSGPSINVIIKDTASDPEAAVWAVRAFAEEDVSAIIGPIITAEAAASEAQNKGIPVITLTQKERITDIGDHVFRNFLTPKMQVQAIVSYAIGELGMNSFAVLYPEEKYGTTFMTLFWDEVESYGGKLVASESYLPSHTDFGSPIRKLSDLHLDAIFIPDSPAKAGLIIPQLAYHNVNRVQLFGTNLWHSEKLIKMADRFARGAIFPDIFFCGKRFTGSQEFCHEFSGNIRGAPGIHRGNRL